MKTKYTALAVDTAVELHSNGKSAATYYEIASLMGTTYDSRDIKQDRYRIIRWLRTEHSITSVTTTRELFWDLKNNQIKPKRVDQYIPAGGRETVGILFGVPETDHILQRHVLYRNTNASKLLVTLGNRTNEIAVLNNWPLEVRQGMAEALLLLQATIEGNGVVTNAMRKMLDIRENIQAL